LLALKQSASVQTDPQSLPQEAHHQAVLCGYYGFGNGGDEALLATLLQMLPETITPIVLSANPEATERQHGVRACDRSNPRQVFQVLRQSQAFIWGGGSLIQDSTSLASPLYYCGLMQLAQTLGLTTIAWAQGVGPLKHPLTRAIARWTFQRCTAFSTRDPGSAALLQSWGLVGDWSPDPVWAMTTTATASLPSTPTVAVTLRPHSLLTPERIDCLVEALIAFQAQTGAKVLLLPFQRSQDRPLALEIQTRLPESEVIEIEDPRGLKALYRRVNMAIAMRLHGVIMAAAEGCRCVALSYDPKVRQLMRDLDCPGWDLDQLPSDPQVLVANWLQVWNQPVQLRQAEIQQRVEAAQRHQDLLEQVLGCG
jgi:polysaccharide pyruvyl transferase CsaB